MESLINSLNNFGVKENEETQELLDNQIELDVNKSIIRYKRYLDKIKIWNEFVYIRINIELFLNEPDPYEKFKYMIDIDKSLITKVLKQCINPE